MSLRISLLFAALAVCSATDIVGRWDGHPSLHPGDRIVMDEISDAAIMIRKQGMLGIQYRDGHAIPSENIDLIGNAINARNFYLKLDEEGQLATYRKTKIGEDVINVIIDQLPGQGPYNMKLDLDRKIRIRDVDGQIHWSHPDKPRLGIQMLKSNGMNYLREGESVVHPNDFQCIKFTHEAEIISSDADNGHHHKLNDLEYDDDLPTFLTIEDNGNLLIKNTEGNIVNRVAVLNKPVEKGPYKLRVDDTGHIRISNVECTVVWSSDMRQIGTDDLYCDDESEIDRELGKAQAKQEELQEQKVKECAVNGNRLTTALKYVGGVAATGIAIGATLAGVSAYQQTQMNVRETEKDKKYCLALAKRYQSDLIPFTSTMPLFSPALSNAYRSRSCDCHILHSVYGTTMNTKGKASTSQYNAYTRQCFI